MTTDKPGEVAMEAATRLWSDIFGQPQLTCTKNDAAARIQAAINEATAAVVAERDGARAAAFELARERTEARAAARELDEAVKAAHAALEATIHETQNPDNYKIAQKASDLTCRARRLERDCAKHAALLAEPEGGG